jgi:enamine deaminase RidA (YjgF/YER057c/UK114 family)
MKPELVQSSAPRPMANYSEAFKVGNLVFAAGQLASDFETGVPSEASINKAFPFYGSEIKQQTRYILDNLRATFEAAGSSLENIVKAQVFMTDMRSISINWAGPAPNSSDVPTVVRAGTLSPKYSFHTSSKPLIRPAVYPQRRMPSSMNPRDRQHRGGCRGRGTLTPRSVGTPPDLRREG